MAGLAVGVSKVDICARALVCLGIGPVDNLDGDDDKTKTCNQMYPMAREEMLSIYPWRFTVVKKQLGRLTAAPVNEWKYAFQLPSDRIGGPRAVFNSSDEGAKPIKSFDIYQGYLYSNEESIWVDYQIIPDESKYPPYFSTLLTYRLAALMAEPLTDDSSKAERYDFITFGTPAEKRMGGFFEIARKIDSQQRPSQIMSQDNSLVDVRF